MKHSNLFFNVCIGRPWLSGCLREHLVDHNGPCLADTCQLRSEAHMHLSSHTDMWRYHMLNLELSAQEASGALTSSVRHAESDRIASNGAASSSGTSPLSGLRVVVLGAGGAGRALAFGAADKGAQVVIANRCGQLPQSLLTTNVAHPQHKDSCTAERIAKVNIATANLRQEPDGLNQCAHGQRQS